MPAEEDPPPRYLDFATTNPAEVQMDLLYSAHLSGNTRATMKLERMSPSTLSLVFIILYGSSILTLLLGTAMVTMATYFFYINATFNYDLGNALIIMDGILRTIGTTLLTFLFVSFPQRIIRDSLSTQQWPPPESVIILLFLVVLFITPAYSLWGLSDFWGQYVASVQSSGNNANLFAFGIVSVIDDYSDIAYDLQVLFTCLNLTLIFVIWGALAYWQGHRFEFDLEDTLEKESSKGTAPALNVPEPEEDPENLTSSRHIRAVDSPQVMLQHFLLSYRASLSALAARCRRALLGLPFRFCITLASYLFLLLFGSFYFHFLPSQVPLVGIISVLRVCTQAPSNDTVALPQSLLISFNSTQYFFEQISPIPLINSLASICSPGIPNDRKPFWRAITVSLLFIIETSLFVQILYIARSSRKRLASLPYAKTRPHQLNFNFFQLNSFTTWFIVFITSIISTAVAPTLYWIYRDAAVLQGPQQYNFTIVIDPLFAVGVTPSTQAWGPFFIMLNIWLYLMAYAYLPLDSNGFFGWFTSTPPSHRTANTTAQSAYFATEKQVAEALKMTRSMAPTGGDVKTPRDLLRAKLLKRTMSSLGFDLPQSKTLGPLPDQILSNVFCLETEILLYHFMYITYDLALLSSDEDKAKLIQDPRFVLAAHIHDPSTDTHCIVCASDDRIVVAFRGTVSLENVKTDLNYSNYEHSACAAIQPLLDANEHGPYAAKMAHLPPYCHEGLVKAYNSVKNKLLDQLRALLEDKPGRVVFVTGHSLGGGLAVVASLDIALSLGLSPSQIAVTTFGAPKIGTFSFVRRLTRVVPSARRIVMSGDIITKMPVGSPLDSLLLRLACFLAPLTQQNRSWHHYGTECMLDVTGNMVIRPSATERVMLQRSLSSTSHHLRLAYATALMAWCVRSHDGEVQFDWWLLVINNWWAKAGKRLAPIAPAVKERLLHDMSRPGATYGLGKFMVRDEATETPEVHFSEEWAEMELVKELKMALELGATTGDMTKYDAVLEQLVEMRQARKVEKEHAKTEEINLV